MCIIALAERVHPEWPLIVAANRDERHDRPTEPLAAWRSGIIAGRDAVAGGTWLGVHPTGRFAALTNIRHDGVADPDAPSRGLLVPAFLTAGRLLAEGEIGAYNPFNLIVWDAAGAALLSNRARPARRRLATGLHLVGNGIGDEEADRAGALRDRLSSGLPTVRRPRDLLDLLGDEGGAGAATDAIFLRDPDYGTRCSTVVAIGRGGAGLIVERRFDRDARATGETAIRFAASDASF